MHRPTLPVVLLCLGAACQTPDVGPVENVLGTAAPLGFLGMAAMTAIGGEAPGCITDVGTCAVFPCVASVEVTIADACPLPFGELSGTFHVDGAWSDAETTVLTVDASDVSGLRFDGAAGFIVNGTGSGVEVVWAEQAVDAGDDQADVSQSGITITVDGQGTAALDDDIFSITGARQTVVDDVARQVAVTDVVFDPGCRENPVAGEAVIQAAGEDEVSVVTLGFHEACDGRADLDPFLDLPLGDNTVAVSFVE